MSERDPDAEIEAEFERFHMVLFRNHFNAEPPQEVTRAAARMVEIATERGDPLMWALVFARMDDFISRGEAPPLPLLVGINTAFTKFRSGVKSLDEAFGLKRTKKGKPVGMSHRGIARTRAEVVAHFIESGDTREVAIEKAASGGLGKALGGVSETTMKRDYLKYRRIT